jgi:hypothetical protein
VLSVIYKIVVFFGGRNEWSDAVVRSSFKLGESILGNVVNASCIRE